MPFIEMELPAEQKPDVPRRPRCVQSISGFCSPGGTMVYLAIADDGTAWRCKDAYGPGPTGQLKWDRLPSLPSYWE